MVKWNEINFENPFQAQLFMFCSLNKWSGLAKEDIRCLVMFALVVELFLNFDIFLLLNLADYDRFIGDVK